MAPTESEPPAAANGAAAQANGSHEDGSRPELALQLLGVLHDAQAQRAEAYAGLQARFQRFLAGGGEGDFREALAEATQLFQVCSDAVRGSIGRLEGEARRPDLAACLRALQQEERQKLHFTLILMALRKAEVLQGFSWQQREGLAAAAVGGEPDPVPGASHASNSHSNGHAGAGHATEQEFAAAVREATQGLQAATASINGTLEELRYEAAELRGEAS